MTEDLASRQLSELAGVDAMLKGAGIDYWLFGGWAVDFYVGAVTRPHDDLDIAVWLTDLPRIAEILEGAGWLHAPAPDEDGGTGYERGPVRLELTFLARDGDGRVVIPLRHGPVEWDGASFAQDVGELRGVRVRLLARKQLTLGKATPRADPGEAAKDRADFAVLSPPD